MKKTRISSDWKFKNLTHDTEYEAVDLPHDYQIKEKRSASVSIDNGAFPDAVGKYVKYLSLTKGRHYVLDVDGAYMCAHFTFNEEHLGMHPNGYTPYLTDLSPYVLDGITNKLVITTTPMRNSTRWYSGNGIYRDVFLWEGGDIRIEPWDLFISTLSASESEATLRIKYTVSADYAADVVLRFTVTDTNAVHEKKLSVTKGKNEGVMLIKLPAPRLWDTEAPNLYTLKTEIIKEGEITDETETVFGVRTVTADATNGLRINGKEIKLRGGCIHHDHGDLGAIALPAAEERKIRKLKSAGFNAVRCAHNPPSLALLEACDKLGIIVMDEAFDSWNEMKCQYDYHIFFADWCERDISYMVQRDRSHPSVISYSIGNEVYEINGTSKVYEWAKRLADTVRRYDDTRFVTSGIQKVFTRKFGMEDSDPEDYKAYITEIFNERKDSPEKTNEITRDFEKSLDIIGTNYYYERYEFDHEQYPDRVIWGSETRALEFFRSWSKTAKYSYVIGDFTWTAFDNVGEAGAGRMDWSRYYEEGATRLTLYGAKYPWKNCYQGDFDLCGFRRPQSYFRESLWRENAEPRIFTVHPEYFGDKLLGTGWHWHEVDECWSFDDRYVGKPIRAEVYGTANKIEWFVNGKYIGESIPIEGIAEIETVYERGSIRAVAYRDGKAYSEYTLFGANEASRLTVEAESREITADGRDLAYVQIRVTDEDGRTVYNDEREITCSVEGGKLLTVFSGDPQSEDYAPTNSCHTFKGRALAVISTKTPGDIKLKVESDGLTSAAVTLSAK